jgi:hypothetical protein
MVESSKVAPQNIFPEVTFGELQQSVHARVKLAMEDALQTATSGVQVLCLVVSV